jgi:DNA mismatch endonuclease (patch repair protein)
MLRRALWKLGLRYRVDARDLPGRPDILFVRARVAVFCDGDFWHGRDLKQRVKKLARGHNAPYWVAKIQSNVARDRCHDAALANEGWLVLRFWEGDILRDASALAAAIAEVVLQRRKA